MENNVDSVRSEETALSGYTVFHLVFDTMYINGVVQAGIQVRVCNRKLYFLFIKTNVVGTQKNRLNETVLLSTPNTCFC